MLLSPLLHGAVGNLDELLACGVGLAIILVLVFIVEARASKEKSAAVNTVDQTVKDEKAP